jgi:Flp pilus assembly pilin Flp
MTQPVHHAGGRLARAARALARDAQGAASVEYVIALCLVCLGATLAIVALGPRLLELYLHQRSILLSPIP